MEDESKVKHLSEWRNEVTREIAKEEAKLAKIQDNLRKSREQLELIKKMLVLEGEILQPDAEIQENHLDFLDACEEVIRKKGYPIHIKQLHEELLSRRVPIPGKGNEANLIARLQRSEGRFIRTGRGTYSLPDFGIPEIKPKKRRRRLPKKK